MFSKKAMVIKQKVKHWFRLRDSFKIYLKVLYVKNFKIYRIKFDVFIPIIRGRTGKIKN